MQSIFTIAISIGCLQSAQKLHNHVLVSIMRWPIEIYDTTPLGRIVNRFSKDINTLDTVLPFNWRIVISLAFSVITNLPFSQLIVFLIYIANFQEKLFETISTFFILQYRIFFYCNRIIYTDFEKKTNASLFFNLMSFFLTALIFNLSSCMKIITDRNHTNSFSEKQIYFLKCF